MWQRIMFETKTLDVPCQNKVEDFILEIIRTYLQQNLLQ